MELKIKSNPLETEHVTKLMVRFAIPSIIAMLIGAVYNLVDQLFIGQKVGTLGNAATNIAFPLSISCVALALLFGIGGASSFNLAMGRKEPEKAAHYVGNSIVMLVLTSVAVSFITLLFLRPMLLFFGSPEDVLPYAESYVRISAVGFPFLMLTIGGGHLIRADGSPKMAMFCNLSGAVLNIILDAVFVVGFEWGMEGAALATVIGQVFSAAVAIIYFRRYKTVSLTRQHFMVRWRYIYPVMSLGLASFINQIAMMVVQIALNNALTYYGAQSEYGVAIPLACAGIVTKVNQIFFSIVIGIAQGTQPIESFNYGARKYDRVKQAYRVAVTSGAVVAVIFFALFQLMPRQIMSLFGDGGESYFRFGTSYFRIFLLLTFVNFLQPITATFFTSIGKPYKGIFMSLTRQILFLLPLILLLPRFMGIDGILYAGPVADFMAAVAALGMTVHEFKLMGRAEKS